MARQFGINYGVSANDPLKDKIHEFEVVPFKDIYIVRQYQLCSDGKVHLVFICNQKREVPMSPADPARYLYPNGGILRRAR